MSEILKNLPGGSYRVAEEEEQGNILKALPRGNYRVQGEGTMTLPSLPEGNYSVEPPTTDDSTPTEEYGPSDLLKPEKLSVVNKFLESRFGINEIDGYTDQEKVDKFLNTMRYFSSGNTVSTAVEVDHILSGDDETRANYHEGISLYEGLAGLTSDKYTWGETLDVVKDFTLGVVVDPINIVAPLYGKAFANAGTKGVTAFAKKMAQQEFKRQIAKGASKGVANQAANKFKGAAVKKYSSKFGKRMAIKEAVGAGVLSTAANVGADLAYQHGLIQTGNRDDFSAIQTGIAALGGLVGVGADIGIQSLRGASRLPTEINLADMSVRDANDLTGVLGDLAAEIKKAPKDRMKKYFEGFKAKVNRGEELPLKDSEFFVDLIMGNDDLGFKGLAPILKDKGFVWRGPRAAEDNFSNWLSDAIRFAPEDEVIAFVKAFEDVSGVTTTDLLRNTGKTIKDKSRGAANVLADNMSKKLSTSGQAFNAMSRGSKLLGGRSYQKLTADDYAAVLFDGDLSRLPDEELSKFGGFVKGSGEGISYAQNTYIRMLVTHPGTSVLNVKGWATKSSVQSAADLLRGTVVYGGGAGLKALKFQGASALNDWSKLTGMYKANYNKALNLLDPYTTKESFDALVSTNPERFKDLVGILPGGVVKQTADEFGIDVTKPLYQQKADSVVDFLQKISLVKAQDVFTKSQELMYNLDVLMREGFSFEGKRLSLADALKRDDLKIIMNSSQYREIEAKAIDRTLENIMSKSYGPSYGDMAPGNIQKIAGFIEEARNIPVIGFHVPFGRFFNSVVATFSEFTGITPALKPFMKGVGDNKSYTELASKAAVAWTGVALMVNRESDLIDRGIAFNEEIDEATGQRVDRSYDAPFIELKAKARIAAHIARGEEVPPGLVSEAKKLVFGQLTRQLSGTAGDLTKVLDSIIALETDEAAVGIFDMVKATASVAVSGTTRFLEPMNAVAALSSDPEDYVVKDLNKTGNSLYKSFRYVDALIDQFSSEKLPKKVTPTESQTSRESGRIFGYRNLSPITASTRVFAMVGRPDWDAGIRADLPEAKNFITSFFQPTFEAHARRLLENPYFNEASLEGKTLMVDEALKSTRNVVHDMLSNSPKLEDRRLQLMFKLTSNKKVRDLDKYLEELGLKVDNIMDLSEEELELLDFFVSDEEDRVERDIYNK